MIQTIIIVFVVYLVAMLLISWRGKAHSSSFSEYLTIDGKAPLILLIGGAVGAQVGNGLVVGGAGSGAAVGIAGIAYGLSCALSYLVLFVFTKTIRQNECLTPPEYLQKQYKSKAIAQILNLLYAISTLPSIAAQMLAAKVLFDAMGINGYAGMIALMVVVFIYSQISGLWGAYATSVVQTAVILVGILAAAGYIIMTGGIAEITGAVATGALPGTFLSAEGYDVSTWLLYMMPGILCAAIDNVSWQRINSAASLEVAKKHFWISSLVMVPVVFAPVLIGMYGRVHFGFADNTAFFGVVLNIFPPVLAALVVVAVVAAVMSTIDGMMIAQSVTLLRGFYKNVLAPNATDEKLNKLTLPCNILTLCGAAVFAFSTNSILGLLANTYLFSSAVCLAPVICGWFWKGTTRKGAVAAMIVGFTVAILQMFGIYSLPYSGITHVIPSFVTIFIVSLLTKERTKTAEV